MAIWMPVGALLLLSALCFALLRGWGIPLAIALWAGGLAAYGAMSGRDALMGLLFVLSFAAPLLIGALGLGAWAGSLLRKGRVVRGSLLLLAVSAGMLAIGVPEWRQAQDREHAKELEYYRAGLPDLPEFPRDAELWIVGTQQSARPQPPSPNVATNRGDVTLKIARGKKPVILVLSNHWPVDWKIQSGRPVAAILLAGETFATVTGVTAPTVKIARDVVSAPDDPDLALLRRRAEVLTGRKLQGVRAAPAGTTFELP